MKKSLIILILFVGSALYGQTNSGGQQTIITGSSNVDGDFEKVGSAGAQFLKVPIGGRGSSMGGAFTSVVNDASAMYWNPSGIAEVENMQAYVAHSTWFGDITTNFAAAVVPITQDFRLGAFVQTFGANDIKVTTIDRPEGTGSFYSINDMSLGITLAGKLTQQFTFGVTAKYVQNAFETVSANGVAFDIGTQYDTGLKGIKLGFSIMNLSTESSYKGAALERENHALDGTTRNRVNPLGTPNFSVLLPAYPFSLPVIFRGGISSAIIDNEEHNLILSGDVITISDSPEQGAIGFDYTWHDIISFRGGYMFNNFQMGLSGGIGVNYVSSDFNGRFEYAAQNTVSLGVIHRINFVLDF